MNSFITKEELELELKSQENAIVSRIATKLESKINESVNEAIERTNKVAVGHIRATHSEKLDYHKWIKSNLQMVGVTRSELDQSIEEVKKTFFLYLGYKTNKWCEVELDVIRDNKDVLSEAIQHIAKLVRKHKQISFYESE